MSCRETADGSAMLSYTRALTDLPDQVLQSEFHKLKRFARTELPKYGGSKKILRNQRRAGDTCPDGAGLRARVVRLAEGRSHGQVAQIRLRRLMMMTLMRVSTLANPFTRPALKRGGRASRCISSPVSALPDRAWHQPCWG